MQALVTAEQMQKLDRLAINKYSLQGIVLMENAGRAFVDEFEQHVGTLHRKKVAVVCGKGNNGGDGFVIARHLVNRGAMVHVGLLGKKKDVKGDAKTNLGILLKMGASQKMTLVVKEISSAKQIEFSSVDSRKRNGVRARDIDAIVDAIFGTGFKGKVKGIYADAVKWINAQQVFVASADIPSGVNATTGIVENIAVKADLTITMGLAKIGQYIGSGREHSGMVKVVDISLPKFILDQDKEFTTRVQSRDVREALPRRLQTAHKYSVGKVLVIAGSRSLTGAPIMTASAAMKTGAGAVVLAVPRSIHQPLMKRVTEVMVMPLDETEDGSIAFKAWEEIEKKLAWADVVAIGPGLGQNLETRKLVHKLVSECKIPIVIDADGLGMVAHNIPLLRSRKGKTVLTPHVGELRLLSKLTTKYIETNRIEVARAQAIALNSILALKGSPTVTATPQGRVFINSTGNPGMATAGSGDVLTGVIASLIAQGMDEEQAAYCGVFVHGMAGDLAARQYGERSLMAMDILACIAESLKAIEAI